MEKNPASIVRNGGIMKLPIGYRFRPTDEELIVHYLTRKVRSIPFPTQVIPELNVFQTNPIHLPGDSAEKRFFFWKRRSGKWRKGRGMTESGYWKPMGKEKHVVSSNESSINGAIGVKKSFGFFTPIAPRGLRTQWVMREYRLLGNSDMEEDEEIWVVCKIYQKKRKPNNRKNKNVVERRSDLIPNVMDVNDDDDDLGPPQPSSCSSEGGGDPEEISSAYIISTRSFVA